MELKWLTRIFTTRKWRAHKRRIFFEKLFEDLKEENNADTSNHGSFSGIKSSVADSYKNSCRQLASWNDYNPILDKSYPKIKKINIGNGFMYEAQEFTSLFAKIKRITPALKTLLMGKGEFSVEITGEENGEKFKFTYSTTVKI